MSSGFLLIDKPGGLTSHDVVAKVRKVLGTKKVGHAGTLDPMATGLLVVGFNQGTKLLTYVVGNDKTYFATIRLGASTVTDDIEGDVTFTAEKATLKAITEADLNSAMLTLTGEISQVPSSVSAIKIAGVRSYDRVRSGEEVTLPARQVTVAKFELLSMSIGEDYIDLEVSVDCSSGTYIRALARDLGNLLGVGGHLTKLRRTRVGAFQVSDSNSLEQLQAGQFQPINLLSASRMILPMLEITYLESVDLRHGKQIQGEITQETAVYHAKDLVAIVQQARVGWLKSSVVFEGDSID
ncbi:MAG: tRNA pseudouridine(55) synthase TruB [Rhodoluna sp.]